MASASTPSLRSVVPGARLRQHRTRGKSGQITDNPIQLPPQFQNIVEDQEEDHARTVSGPALQGRSLYGIVAQADDISEFTQRWQQQVDSEPEEEDTAPATQDYPKSIANISASHPEHRKQDKKLYEPRPDRTHFKLGRERTESPPDNLMTQSQILSPKETVQPALRQRASAELRIEAPVLGQRLRAQARAERDQSIQIGSGQSTRRSSQESLNIKGTSATLANVLAEIFSFQEPEEVIAEFPCWFLQSSLFQGYMYITQKHVCFYAYLQKKSGHTLKSGMLGKRGQRNPRYSQYHFTLKGTTMTYFADAAQPYFPAGTIDLRYAISAELDSPDRSAKDSAHFTITTDTRTYQLRAGSTASAQEWVKQLQKVIFRSHNDGDSVKVSLPLDNVADVVSNPMLGTTDTVKVLVVNNDSSLDIDEYFFTFPDHGEDAMNVLTALTKDNRVRKVLAEQNIPHRPDSSATGVRENVRSTIVQAGAEGASSSVVQAQRPGIERGRSSFERPRQSSGDKADTYSSSRLEAPLQAKQSTASPLAQYENAELSASQILGGDAAFADSTVRRSDAISGPVPHLSSTRSSQHSIPGASVPSSKQEPSSSHKSLPATSVRPTITTIPSAAALAGYVRDQSKRMSSFLSGSPREYYEKFSGALAGGKRHYMEADGLAPEDRVHDPEDDLMNPEHERRFREYFALPDDERLVAIFFCSLHRILPLYGKIYIGTNWLCYRSLLPGTKTKIVIPFRDVDNVEKNRGFRLGFPGMVLVLRGHEELFFDFRNSGLRDDCVVTMLRNLDTIEALRCQHEVDTAVQLSDDAATENRLLQQVRSDAPPHEALSIHDSFEDDVLFDDTNASVLDFKPQKSLRIVCLTIGSRGDVQPYIALCKGLLAEGHRPKIATHVEFGDWVKSHGIDFTPVGGNPAELMKLCVELGMFTPRFIYETNYKFRGWLDELLETAWKACRDCDLLIESPSAMAGIHIAEALGVPYFRAFTMMWTRTRAYPHAFATTNYKMGGSYNLTTYGLFENVFWQLTAAQINRWRMKTLKIGPTTSRKLQQNKVPFLYNFSPSFVVPPLDFSDWVRITGYWFLDEGTDWTAPADLLGFIKKARQDKVKLVYIGFGSIVVSDSRALTKSVVDAVKKADVRCILSKGWSDRLDTKNANEPEIELGSNIYKIGPAPHDWLFRQVDAAVHHGGAGTTGASLRAGIPTIIKPFFGDQFFSAIRVEDIGVGMRVDVISENVLGKALWIATHDDRMRKKARLLGEKIRAEDGVSTAIKAIYRDLEYAKTLIKRKGARKIADEGSDDEEQEESWTFVEADSDPEIESASAQLPSHGPQDASIYSRYNLGSLTLRRRYL